MSSDLEITGINLSRPRVSGEEKFIDVEITVKNNSNVVQYVISSLQGLKYDKSDETLFIGLSEQLFFPEAASTNMFFHRIRPSVISIPPRESHTIKVSIPLVIRRILTPKDSSKIYVELSDISKLEHIVCRVSHDIVPIPAERNLLGVPEGKEYYMRGKTIKKKFDIKLFE